MRAFLLSLALAHAAVPLSALELTLRDSFEFPRAASLAYDAEVCGFWVAIEGPQIFLLNPAGQEVRRVEPGFRTIRSLTVEVDGLMIADGYGSFQRIDREGNALSAPFRLAEGLYDVEGLHREPDGSYLVVEDDAARLMRIAPDGERLLEILGTAVDPIMTEPQGVARDPITGNILVVDDNEGLNAIFEFTGAGELLSVTPLSAYGWDAEGIAVQAQTGTLWVGFDSGQRIAIFDYVPTRPPEGLALLDDGPDCALS
ncbi:MAG: hypothetical protein AAFU80_08295 [Pseudomonadota bacterium]